MVYWKGLKIGIILSGSIAFMCGCTLDDPGSSGANPPLTLHAEQNLSLITLSWDPVKVTGFKEYVLLQSTSDIPNSPTPEINVETTVLKRIDDSDVHTFTMTNTLFSPRLCFKLYTSVDNRFLYSSTLCIDQDITLFNGFYDRAGHEEGLDKIIAFDRSNLQLSIIDYKNGSITTSVNENNLSFPIIEVSTFEGTTDVFAYDQSPPRLRKYGFPQLNILAYKDFGSVLYAVKAHKEFIFVADNEFTKAFKVLNRSNLNLISSYPETTENKNIAVFDGDPLIVIIVTELLSRIHHIDATGKITFIDHKETAISQLSSQTTTANSDDYFIGGRFGTIINRDAEVVGALKNDINSAVSMVRFSADKSKLVSIISDNVGINLEIYDASVLPSISKIGTYPLPQANYADVIIENDIIYVFGITFAGGLSQTFILKYPV